jgi:transcription elongation factor Elf1
MSNYPPGVTGNEWQIAGPYAETEETLDCPECEKPTLHVVTTLHRYDDVDSCVCTVCEYEWDRKIDSPEDYTDPYDSWRDGPA